MKKGVGNDKKTYHFMLVGNPNVGKSLIFNRLTGLDISTANYPGTTVQINQGSTKYKDRKIKITDIPGTYAIDGISEDQLVAVRAIIEQKPDCIIAIADTTNLQRNLYLVLQLLDMGLPVVLGLNLSDIAESKKIKTNIQKLEKLLGIPVVSTVATQGKGLDQLIKKALNKTKTERKYKYGSDFEKQLILLTKTISKIRNIPYDLSPQAFSFLLMENESFLLKKLSNNEKEKAVNALKVAQKEIKKSHDQPLKIRIALERHGLAGNITSKIQKQEPAKERIQDKLWRLSTHPVFGMITLIASITLFFVLVVASGVFLSIIFDSFWKTLISPNIRLLISFIFGKGLITNTLIWGFDEGIKAALGIGVAFILPFYFLMSILEDSGYLNSIAFLTDRLAHRVGLHGRSFIPLISAAGCSVPAIMGTRALGNKRERTIASTLIIMIPCSARTAVILGTVTLFSGWLYTGLLYLLLIGIIFLTGFSLNKLLPGNATGLVMEMFELRLPSIKTILKKTWLHLKYFISAAFPYIIIGSLIMGFLFELGYLEMISKPLSFLTVGLLGLPAITGIILLAGFLRKEMALELLIVLAAAKFGTGFKSLLDLMTREQLFIFALVVSLYIPCIAALSILIKELGWKRAVYISAFTIILAFFAGGIFNQIFRLM